MTKDAKKRTHKQNASLHLWCEQLAESLNDAGLSVQQVLEKAVERPWTKESVKENIWRPVQKAMTEKESTADADTVDYLAVFEVLTRHLGESFGVYVPWPCREELMQRKLGRFKK